MRLTKRQLKRIIREEYTRLQRQGLLSEALSSDPNNSYGMRVADDPVIAQAVEKQDAIPRGHDWRKPEIFGYCNQWLSLIDQCINRMGQRADTIARKIERSGIDGKRGWQCCFRLLSDIPGNEEHMDLCEEISDIMWENQQRKYRR